MPVIPKTFVDPVVVKMIASCPPNWKPNDNTKALFRSFAAAYADMITSWLKSMKVIGGVVAGGVAASGGPVAGATLTLAPGSAQAAGYKKISDVFIPPKFSVVLPTGETKEGSFTPWLRGAVNTVSTEVDTQLKLWSVGWLAAGLPVVVGGTAAWIPPIPPAPPAPGPWIGGTVTPFLFSGPGGGLSTGQLLVDNIKTTLDARCRATSVSIQTDTQGGTTTTELINNKGESDKLFKVLALGFTTLFTDVLAMAMLKDASGSGGSGIAAPGGIITGVMGPLTIDI